MTIEVWLPYREDDPVAHALGVMGETADAEPVGEGLVRLTSSTSILQLVPGDVLRVDSAGHVVGIHELADMWFFIVHTATPNMLRTTDVADPDAWDVSGFDDANWEAAALTADQVEEELSRRAPVKRTTRYTVEIVTESRTWFDQWLSDASGLDFYELVRQPGQTFTWEQAQIEAVRNERPIIHIEKKD